MFTVSTAESCTGGNIAHLITSVAGSSAYYKGGVVSYCNQVKTNLLDVKASDIETYGVVSSTVAEAMAMGVRKLLDTDYAVATTGVAGPGASEGIPAGTVWVGICSRTEVKSKCLHLGSERVKNIDEASRLALEFLQKEFGIKLI